MFWPISLAAIQTWRLISSSFSLTPLPSPPLWQLCNFLLPLSAFWPAGISARKGRQHFLPFGKQRKVCSGFPICVLAVVGRNSNKAPLLPVPCPQNGGQDLSKPTCCAMTKIQLKTIHGHMRGRRRRGWAWPWPKSECENRVVFSPFYFRVQALLKSSDWQTDLHIYSAIYAGKKNMPSQRRYQEHFAPSNPRYSIFIYMYILSTFFFFLFFFLLIKTFSLFYLQRVWPEAWPGPA